MAKLVDALCSGRSVRKDVLVRIQFWAPRPSKQLEGRFSFRGARLLFRIATRCRHDHKTPKSSGPIVIYAILPGNLNGLKDCTACDYSGYFPEITVLK